MRALLVHDALLPVAADRERGALLVIPNDHFATALDLDVQLLATIHCEAVLLGRALIQAFGATGLNIFQNNGVDAGQSEPHYHVHVVPRYQGSDPHRIFHSRNVEPVRFADQLEIAAAVCRAPAPPDNACMERAREG